MLKRLKKIALISTPWPLYSRPSIQLGTLKAFLNARMPKLQVDTFHFYLQLAEAIGYRLYHEISERTWLAESMYAALLYPGRSQQAEALFRKESSGEAFAQLKTLDELPAPDYDDYFNLLDTFEPGKRFFPTLPVETSRGCWWKRAVGSGRVTGCAFCNLNLQWDGYRSKSATRVAAEIDRLTGRHQTLSVALMDNVLPKKNATDLFVQIAKLKKDLRLFAEVRATTPLKELEAMRACGMREVQIGIEALSSRLLKKLHKGTSAIQNLEIMKNCEALGIRNISNLILQFPGSNAQDVAETLRALEFALPFHPLKAVSFWLGLESPVWQQPKKFGIRAVFNHPNWSYLFPADIYRTMPLMIQAYRGDLTVQKKLWKPVKKKIAEWQKRYAEIKKDPGDGPILSLRDGRDFIIIHQRRLQAEPAVHRLVGVSRQIYLYCQKHRAIKAICSAFPNIPVDSIVSFLNMMVDKKLMFAEKNKVLSLAAPAYPKKETTLR